MVVVKKNGQKSWVTFTVSPTVYSDEVDAVMLSGEWNKWGDEPMKKKKNGDFYLTKILKTGERFQFGYKLNGKRWIHDTECLTVVSPFESQNSLLEL